MYRATVTRPANKPSSFGQDFTDLREAIAYASSGENGRIVDSDGVHMRIEFRFKGDQLVFSRIWGWSGKPYTVQQGD